MRKVEGDALRTYHLDRDKLGNAVDTLVALAEGAAGATIALTRLGDSALPPVIFEPSLLGPVIDLVSLLTAKGSAKVLVLDGNDEVSKKEAQVLLQVRWQTLERLLAGESNASMAHLKQAPLKLDRVLDVLVRGQATSCAAAGAEPSDNIPPPSPNA